MRNGPQETWNSAGTSASRKKRMEAADWFQSITNVPLAATIKLTGDRL